MGYINNNIKRNENGFNFCFKIFDNIGEAKFNIKNFTESRFQMSHLLRRHEKYESFPIAIKNNISTDELVSIICDDKKKIDIPGSNEAIGYNREKQSFYLIKNQLRCSCNLMFESQDLFNAHMSERIANGLLIHPTYHCYICMKYCKCDYGEKHR